MQLLTDELIRQFEKTGRQEHVEDPVVIAKFFNPCGSATWLATEYYPDDRLFFGYASLFNDPFCNEWGYFSLDELQELRCPPFGLPIERDLYFEQSPISVVKEREKIW
jgi:hypothetical protein